MPPFRIEWLNEARADVRRLDRTIAMRIFDVILRYAQTGVGDVAPLDGALAAARRLRVGDYRVLFRLEEGVMQIFAVLHRSEAYR